MQTIIKLLSLIVFITSCGNKNIIEEKEKLPGGNIITLTDAQMKNAQIETGNVEQKQIASTLKLNGRIDVPPQNMISISVPLGGYLHQQNFYPACM